MFDLLLLHVTRTYNYILYNTRITIYTCNTYNLIFNSHLIFCLFQLFDHLKELRGVEVLNKVYPIAGDVSEPNLAINESDRRLLADTVQIVFHAAATIRFDEPLKKAVLLNTRGTKMVLELAKEMKNLLVRFCTNPYNVMLAHNNMITLLLS